MHSFSLGGRVFGSSVVNVESWRIVTTLRGHKGDILDVAWSPQDVWLASASIDNNVIIWNASKWPGKEAKLIFFPFSKRWMHDISLEGNFIFNFNS